MIKIINLFLLLLAPLLSGVLLVLAFPNYDHAWLGWVGLMPLLLIIRRLRPWQAFLSGWLAGIIYFVGIFPWINEVQSVSKLAIGLGHLYLGLYFSLFFAITCLFIRRFSLPLLTAAPVWVAVEYLRAHFFFLGFPWALLGHTQYLHLPIIQIASFTGAYGVSFIMVLVNGAISDLLVHWIGRKKPESKEAGGIGYKPVTICVLVLFGIAALWVLGWRVLSKEVPGTPISVAVVQGNISQGVKWNPGFSDQIVSTYERLSEKAVRFKPHLIVWPETSTPGLILKNMRLLKRMIAMIKRLKTYFLVGSAEYPKFGKDPLKREKSGNTALFFSPKGKVLGQYLKIRLIPLWEYIPYDGIIHWPHFIIPPGKKNFIIAGTESIVFNLARARFGVLICWENIYPDLSRRLVKRGADFIVNISNEAWFGETAAPYQILSMCVFRAVENRIPMVRATNTGISCFIDSHGRVKDRIRKGDKELFVDGVGIYEVPLSSTGTFYTRYGDIMAFSCLAFTLCLILWSAFKGIWRASCSESRSKGGEA